MPARKGTADFQLRVCDLPDDTAAGDGAGFVARPIGASGGGAVHVAARVKCHVTHRISPVAAAAKGVQRGVRCGGCQLKNVANTVAECCAVKIAFPQSEIPIRPTGGAADKGVKRSIRPGAIAWRQLESRT